MNVLLYEDDACIMELIVEYLEELNFTVDWCLSSSAIFRRVENNIYDLAVLDLKVPHMDGFELAYQIKQYNKDLPMIGITGLDDFGQSLLHKDDGKQRIDIDIILVKPFTFQDLEEAIKVYFNPIKDRKIPC